jgi:spectrin alpha
LFQRKHEGVERDLAALEDKVTTLGQEADRLCGIHADHGDQIQSKRDEIAAYWMSLTTKVSTEVGDVKIVARERFKLVD